MHTVPYSRDNTSHDELSDSERGGLEDSPDNHPNSSNPTVTMEIIQETVLRNQQLMISFWTQKGALLTEKGEEENSHNHSTSEQISQPKTRDSS